MSDIGCLIIHGFAGNRQEIRPLAAYLEKLGYVVATPLLAGHESLRKCLSRSTYIDWIQSAATELENLMKRCDKVLVIGFSMGGLIAANLYQAYKFDGLVFINTPVYYFPVHRILYNLSHDFRFFFKKYMGASTNKTFFALIQFLILLHKTKPLFSRVLCTSLIIQTMDDDTVNPKSAEFIYKQVSGKKKIKKYAKGGHVVFYHNSNEDIFKEIELFCAAGSYTI